MKISLSTHSGVIALIDLADRDAVLPSNSSEVHIDPATSWDLPTYSSCVLLYCVRYSAVQVRTIDVEIREFEARRCQVLRIGLSAYTFTHSFWDVGARHEPGSYTTTPEDS